MSKQLFFVSMLCVFSSWADVSLFAVAESYQAPPERCYTQASGGISRDTTICKLSSASYRPYARQWFNQYIQTDDGTLLIKKQEVAHITRLVKSSLARSQVTLDAQERMWQAMGHVWHAWQNLIQTRLNPSKKMPYVITAEQKDMVQQQCWDAFEQYETTCKEYCQIAQEVVHGTVLDSTLAKEAVAQMRSEVRFCMINALADVKQHFELLYKISFKGLDEQMLEACDETQHKSFNLASFVMEYVPKLAMHKFIEADALYTNLSQEGWSILDKIQLVGNHAWHAIETARANFYQALLDELQSVARNSAIATYPPSPPGFADPGSARGYAAARALLRPGERLRRGSCRFPSYVKTSEDRPMKLYAKYGHLRAEPAVFSDGEKKIFD